MDARINNNRRLCDRVRHPAGLQCASPALASNASALGSLVINIAGLLLSSSFLLGLCNAATRKLQMFGCVVYQEGEPKKYTRRLDMAEQMIKFAGRDDWAIGMGLIVPPKSKVEKVNA